MSGGFDRGAVWAGLFFLIAGTAFLLDRLDVLRIRAAWILPVVLIALGTAVLAGGRERT